MNSAKDASGSARPPVTLMAHLVAGYPTAAIALEAARGLARGGISSFEVQFPFSDPSADGTSIQTACSAVLARGYTVAEGFDFVAELRRRYPAIPVYIMTYANLAYKAGIPEFVSRAARAGAAGLIIPDLPFDHDEGLAAACALHGIAAIPVAAPSMTAERLSALGLLGRPYVYAALRSGITGSTTLIDEGTLSFIRSVAGSSHSRILGGFGIRNGAQAAELSGHVHAVVAGSVFVDLIRENAGRGGESVCGAVEKKAHELTGKS
jgi:tryptophan synthase alpha chain